MKTARAFQFIIHHSAFSISLVRPYGVHDAAPDLEVHALDDLDGLVLVVLGHEPDAAAAEAQALDAELVVDARDDDIAVVGLDGAVYDEYRAGVYPRPRHRVARDAHVEGRHGVFDEVAVQVEVPLDVALGGRWEARRDRRHEERAFPARSA